MTNERYEELSDRVADLLNYLDDAGEWNSREVERHVTGIYDGCVYLQSTLTRIMEGK